MSVTSAFGALAVEEFLPDQHPTSFLCSESKAHILLNNCPVLPSESMATKYQKLSSQDVLDLMAAMKKNFQWEKEPRAFQVKAVQAQLEGMDIVIQAPTGAGKTAIAAGPHVWPTMKGRITIMISPLLALETEMVKIPIPRCHESRLNTIFRWIHSE